MFCPKCKAEYREGFSTCADCGIDLVPTLPPEPEKQDAPMAYVDLVKIKTFSNRYEAELAKGFLISNGIYAAVAGDDYGGIQPALSFATGVYLLVGEADAEKSIKLLRAAD